MKGIPEDKLRFYSKQHQSLRKSREQLEKIAGTPKVNLSSLSGLELEVVKEAFRAIARQGREVLVTHDPYIYAQDLKRGDGKVLYLLCDEEGHLQDMTPLLEFVSPDKRREYEASKREYLNSE